ncbi:mannitol-1-phosphate 5-dehydrogenase [Aerococcus kribbianus]|uniref:Mannitol-1-phosphate 5-dehydrogenase n=1 Tax=Aerococcus kribbianus TaxID=2999064 RepID=A0A9X3FQ17_9LACT|nr:MULTISPECIES: mannitol-1-phosphate 5-dehydrogenase [unclassified Aerococcus]MCZ0717613.1 mannitol-1-phosphate 5-dehydrogenase [Aerococcus sp. YH-aer221]MCZ0725901.1 mannitol-1-phosphate 5-dehydrogenase [Aerococcus sp. YH-aer222]
MKQAVHFGAGNIGRGFIGEILHKNGFHITFVDINDELIDALNERDHYTVAFADEKMDKTQITDFSGINNGKNPDAVIEAVKNADIVTTAIGPNVLPFIAELIAKGLQARQAANNTNALDVIACENMIGGSDYLYQEVIKHLDNDTIDYLAQYVGFPNAAVDRIVPIQSHEDPLYVSVEPFSEWVVDETHMKATDLKLSDVLYVDDLEPYIERKLFSVNTGHATTAYTGRYYGYETIDQALEDDRILNQLKGVLQETGALLVDKWGFDPDQHQDYANKIVQRFQNKYISDAITRVARTPIRKLGYNERFIGPLRECQERGLNYDRLKETVAMIFKYDDPNDAQSQELQEKLTDSDLDSVIKEVTGLTDTQLIAEISQEIEKLA